MRDEPAAGPAEQPGLRVVIDTTRPHQARVYDYWLGASYLEFWFGENGRHGQSRHRPSRPADDPARRNQDLTPVDIRLGPVDLEMLDVLITAGTAASRAEAIGWVLARIRERPAYSRLRERARELDELKADF